MKKRCGWGKLAGVLLAALPLLCGCGVLPDMPLKGDERHAARLEILLDADSEEEVAVVWDPAVVAVERTEVSVGEDDRVVVTVELRPVER